MTLKRTSSLLNTDTDPRELANKRRRDFLDFLLKSSAGALAVAAVGDSHNGWFANLTTLAGDKVGVEFAGTSVTSSGFEGAGLGTLASAIDGSALVPQLGNAAIGAGLGLIDDMNYCDTARRGYLVMTVTAAEVKGEYVYVSTVKEPTYTAAVGRTVTVAATAGGTAAPVIA